MARHIGRLARVLALLTAAGCIQLGPDGDAPVTRHHAIDAPSAPRSGEKGAEAPRMRAPPLAVRPFSAPERYDERVVRRGDDGSLEFLEFDRWAERPEDALFHGVQERLAASGRFEAVFDAAVDHRAELTLDGHLVACDLAADRGGRNRARLTVRLDLGRRHDGRVLHSQVYSAERPLSGTATAGLGGAMSACLADVLDDALAAWTKSGALPR